MRGGRASDANTITVIPGRRTAANPESSTAARQRAKAWIPGSRRRAPRNDESRWWAASYAGTRKCFDSFRLCAW
jgi:hypothetical protein